MRRSNPLTRAFCLWFFAALLASGCTQLPDVRPFADATATMQEGVNKTGDLTIAMLKVGDAPLDLGTDLPLDDPNYLALDVARQWEVRRVAVKALVSYADSLAAITEAANAAQNNTQELGDTLVGIADSLPGISAPSKEVVALATKIGEIAIQVKGAHDLGEAVKKAEPAVEAIAEILQKNTADLKQTYLSEHRIAQRRRFTSGGSAYSQRYLAHSTHWVTMEQQVLEARRKLQRAVNDGAFIANATLLDELDKHREGLSDEQFEKLREVLAASGFPNQTLAADLKQKEELLAQAKATFLPYKQDYLAMTQQREQVAEVFDQTEAGIRAWLQTHKDLSKAVDDKRRPNWRELLATAQELHQLIEAIDEDKPNVETAETE